MAFDTSSYKKPIEHHRNFQLNMNLFSFILFFYITSSTAIFHPHFAKFIKTKFGKHVLKHLQRVDLGALGGSFGGGDIKKAKHRPIVFVHGLRNKAGNIFWNQRKVFAENGWPIGRLLATSYGPGEVDTFRGGQESMKCAYAKQVRNMLLATSRYFKSKIDVIAYSMGAPIARKAIMGGKCVDTHEDLGGPLTNKINTFMSVAGTNYGSYWCSFPGGPICNPNTGLMCNSNFIKDVHSKSLYEGKHLYSIASVSDEVTGFWSLCGKKIHEFRGATEILKYGINHEDTMYKTMATQLELIKRHS